jgi:glycosyltransferase involved in cell wall biosynthesis
MAGGPQAAAHVLVTYVMVGRGGDAVQLRALVRAFGAGGYTVNLVGGVPLTPYADGGAAAQARALARKAPWFVRDLLEIVLSVVVAARAVWIGRAYRCRLHVHRAGIYDGAMALAARYLGVPLVLYVDTHVEAEREAAGQRYWRGLHAWAARALGRSAAVIAAPSKPIADYYTGLGLPAARFVVVGNGVTRSEFQDGIAALRDCPPMRAPARCTVGFVGSLSRWHRVDVLLHAIDELRRTAASPDMYHLVIVGHGAQHTALRSLARSLGLDDAVEWRGAVPHDDAIAVMREFDVAALPGTLPTGAPMKLTEYAAMGRAIVAPDLPNVRAMFQADREIILVRPADPHALAESIRALAAAPETAKRLGAAAQARVRGQTWEDMAQLLQDRALGRETARGGAAPVR